MLSIALIEISTEKNYKLFCRTCTFKHMLKLYNVTYSSLANMSHLTKNSSVHNESKELKTLR